MMLDKFLYNFLKRTSGVIFILIIILFIYIPTNSYAQSGVGGTKSTFLSVGARALALGNAYVALSEDPTAVFWNPAGLDYLEKKSTSFYYTSLIAGSNFSFVGFVYPTVSIGSFGFGWLRLGTGDIEERGSDAEPGANFDFSQQQFLFSYAKQLKKSFSIGLTVKIESFSFSIQNLSDSGVGADLGLLYRPDFDSAILRDLSLGINIQNIINPKTRLVDMSESSPINFKIGLAKPVRFGEARNAFTLLFDINKSESAPMMYNLGGEYSFHNQAMLRIGVNDGQIAFGAGASYSNFHIDYSFGKLFDGPDFSANHRFSVTIEFGKGKTELIRIARERREREMRLQVENQMWFSREIEFNNSMEEGRDKYFNGDYLGAYVDFSNAFEAANTLVEVAMRLRGENIQDEKANIRVETANSALQESRTMLELADAKRDSVQKEEQKQIVLQAKKSALEQELQDFILEHRQKGNAFFKNGDFTRAIREWQLALNRIAANKSNNLPNWVEDVRLQIINDINTTEKQLQGNIKEKIRQADALARRGDYVQALAVLNELRGAELSEEERSTIRSKITKIQTQLNFQQNYEQGIRHYANKEYKKAMEYFERALRIKSKDPRARKFFEDAKARAQAKIQEMPPDIQAKYVRAIQLYRQKMFKEALEILEQIRVKQPYNKRILDLIDRAKDRLKENR
ncbi:MAG: PorV/PorQ family protein [bacterium]